MKQRLALLIVFFTLQISSCRPDYGCHVSYVVEGVRSVSLQKSSEPLNLDLQFLDCIEERVAIEVEGLPHGIEYNLSVPEAPIPFSTTLTLTDVSAIPGTYPCQLVFHGNETGMKTYDFTVKVKARPICGLIASYNGISDCGIANFIDTISAINVVDESDVNQVRFANFGGRGFGVTGIATCSSGTIVLPSQEINASTSISGQGIFTSLSTITIYYTIIINGVATACQFTINR